MRVLLLVLLNVMSSCSAKYNISECIPLLKHCYSGFMGEEYRVILYNTDQSTVLYCALSIMNGHKFQGPVYITIRVHICCFDAGFLNWLFEAKTRNGLKKRRSRFCPLYLSSFYHPHLTVALNCIKKTASNQNGFLMWMTDL